MVFGFDRVHANINIVDLSNGIVSAVLVIGQNAPMGVGSVCSAIQGLMAQIKVAAHNRAIIAIILRDMDAFQQVLPLIVQNINPVFNQPLENITRVVTDITNMLVDYKNMGMIARFFKLKNIQENLNLSILEFQTYKNTLQIALHLGARHIIPGSTAEREAAVAPVTNQSDMGDNICMMIKLGTGKRCDRVFPKYSLVSRTKGYQAIYHVCGYCAAKNGTWWKKAYDRINRSN